jgi:hypothetical protein
LDGFEGGCEVACEFEGEAVAVGRVFGGIEIKGEAEVFICVSYVEIVALPILENGYK